MCHKQYTVSKINYDLHTTFSVNDSSVRPVNTPGDSLITYATEWGLIPTLLIVCTRVFSRYSLAVSMPGLRAMTLPLSFRSSPISSRKFKTFCTFAKDNFLTSILESNFLTFIPMSSNKSCVVGSLRNFIGFSAAARGSGETFAFVLCKTLPRLEDFSGLAGKLVDTLTRIEHFWLINTIIRGVMESNSWKSCLRKKAAILKRSLVPSFFFFFELHGTLHGGTAVSFQEDPGDEVGVTGALWRI